MSFQKSTRHSLVQAALIVLFLGLPSAVYGQLQLCPKIDEIQGNWEDKSENVVMAVEPARLIVAKTYTWIVPVLKAENCRWTVRAGGLRSTWEVAKTEEGFALHRGAKTLRLTRLARSTPVLDVRPWPLGKAGPVSKERVAEIADALAARARADQTALKGPDTARGVVLDQNKEYLRQLLTELGWIDIDRFGKMASSAALLIAKHGSDLRIITAVLPVAEKDAREHSALGEMISVLYDEVQLNLGNRQRYGTQIVDDSEGKGLVLPVEDSAKVDTYRKQLGIRPWKEYLDQASKALYQGIPLRVAGEDEEPAGVEAKLYE